MDEEFIEVDILWPEEYYDSREKALFIGNEYSSPLEFRAHRKSSDPIEIPSRTQVSHSRKLNLVHVGDSDDDEDENIDGSTRKMIPPHIVIAQRIANDMDCLFYYQRPHKDGRNLTRVRDSILRMTGFIEI
ncbi:protein S40-3-like [Curcuma longa]|uniref:protein S40-3-like n=1 Tax=Curcuma longa TaxID=136217 RepID=UPI003D9E92FF